MQPASTDSRDARASRHWPEAGLTRIPFWIYRDPDTYRREQQRIYHGATWNYLCLEAELAQPGDFVNTFVGETPVIAARDHDGEVYAFENRCSHRGALISLENSGRVERFTCVYHSWSYDLQGNLKGVAFQNGVNGKGGMPAGFDLEDHHPRKLRVAVVCGLVFGSFSDEVPPIEDYIGEAVLARIERIMNRPVEVLGRFTQRLPNNWKLYFENVKDSYHASLLHLFLTTFDVNRLTQKGGLIVSDDGGSHVSYSMIEKGWVADNEYRTQQLRAENDKYRLHDPSFLTGTDEFGDGITLQILSVFPGFVMGQIWNSVVVRQILPRGIDETDLHWTYIGFEGDTPEMRHARLKQSNLIGPAGVVSMEDGCVGGFVQRGTVSAEDEMAIVQMGGDATGSSDTRATEASVRGFWKAYRSHMGL
jgi:anthranilate 1,2-dioxygenase large subunit/terephthalate 1,2-dioxygenase oxygenase component alpha subunit